MKNKILIIITRIIGTEFSNYWKYQQYENFSVIKIKNDFVLFLL